MPRIKHNLTIQQKRKMRVRSKLHGTAARPRVTVDRSNKYIFIQAVNDDTGVTLASAGDKALRDGKKAGTKTETAAQAAAVLAEALKKQKISAVVFYRGQYKYHGRVSKVAETLREKGIEV